MHETDNSNLPPPDLLEALRFFGGPIGGRVIAQFPDGRALLQMANGQIVPPPTRRAGYLGPLSHRAWRRSPVPVDAQRRLVRPRRGVGQTRKSRKRQALNSHR